MYVNFIIYTKSNKYICLSLGISSFKGKMALVFFYDMYYHYEKVK